MDDMGQATLLEKAAAGNGRYLDVLGRLGPISSMVLPLVARGRRTLRHVARDGKP